MQGHPVSSATPFIGCALLALILVAGTFLTPVFFHFFSDDAPSGQPADSTPITLPATPPRHPSKTDRPEFPNAGAYVRHELQSIIIPKVDFEGATVEEAIDFLRQRSRELSGKPPERAGFGFVVRKSRIESGGGDIDAELDAETGLGGSDPGQKTLTLKAENVPLLELLEEVCRQAKLRMEITTQGLIEIGPCLDHSIPPARPPADPNDPFTGAPDPFSPRP